MRNKKEILVCECGSTDHQMVFLYLKGEAENEFDWIDIEIHLSSYKGFWARVVASIKYIFGYRSRYGNWDVFEINEDNCDKLIEHLQQMKANHKKIREFVQQKSERLEGTVNQFAKSAWDIPRK